MKTFTCVISLSTEKERRQNISNQLNNIGFNFKFYNSFDFRNEDEEVVNSNMIYDHQYKKPSRQLTKGEVGCTLSHITLLRELIHEKSFDNFLILEDDAKINSKISNLLSSNELNEFEWDIIILGYSKLSYKDFKLFYLKEPIKTIKKINEIKIGTVWKEWTCGTVGYLVNNKSIDKFKELKPSSVADDWNYIKNKLNLKIFHTRPLLVLEDFNTFSSAIEDERKQFLKKNIYILEPVRIMRGILRRLFFLLKSFNPRK